MGILFFLALHKKYFLSGGEIFQVFEGINFFISSSVRDKYEKDRQLSA